MNLFVCLEGVDCAGKTTVAKRLAQEMNAVYYKSPGGVYAERRKEFDEAIEPSKRYRFYREAVQYDSGEIIKLLESSSVVCDRYIYSTFAFHAAMDPALEFIFEHSGVILPHYVFLLTACEEVRRKRRAERKFLSGVDGDFVLQNKADHIFRLQGHTLIDTSTKTEHETTMIIMDLLLKGGHYAQKS